MLYPLQDENLVLCFYLSYRISVEVIGGNLTRCQRAPEGTEQSTACCSYQVIQSRGMRFFYFGRDAVVFSNLAVDAEENRFLYAGYMGAADFALHRLYPNLREVGNIGHTISFSHFLQWYPRLRRPMRLHITAALREEWEEPKVELMLESSPSGMDQRSPR